MRKSTHFKNAALVGSTILLGIAGCEENDVTLPGQTDVILKNHSVTPALVKNVMPGLEVYSLMGSDDTFEQSPNFIFGGSADGAGLLKNSDGTYSFLVNHEDNFSVSRVTLDKTFKPVKGEYILNSDGGMYRLCSATMATPAEHGFGPTFITCGESGPDSEIHAVDPVSKNSQILKAFGRWSTENAVPLPKSAYSDKTVVIIGDDDSGEHGGQVAMYVGNSGDLNNGNLYVLARTNDNIKERDMVAGQSYAVEFRQIPNQKSLAPTEFNTKSTELKSIQFGRVEDIDYRKNAGQRGRELYFTVTGQNNTQANADYSRTKYGRVYRLVLDAKNPLKGTLEVILDGDDRSGIAGKFQNPDNIMVATNYVYIQEDPNGYGDETHDAYIYQYDIASKQMKVVMELDHKRGDAKYNVGGDSKFGTWEYGALIDVSAETSSANTFMLAVQPHSWRGDKYKNPDSGSKRPDENQASQILMLKGLPK
ncbi:MAG TPA: hypothetical protein VEC36_12205 [Patescibacteria group bacterium]|nr:hypothetical protein [Patescibacteria group bacterium]